jgi:endonuclease III
MPEKRSRPSLAVRQRALTVAQLLADSYGNAECALHHQNAFQLLVATILSAQCTDERVNQVTPALFRRYPTPESLSKAELSELEQIIRSTGFFHAKATNLKSMAGQLVDRHQGEVPADLEALVQLAGVGRKTANVVLGTVFGIPSGVVVDTHVKRIVQLLGLTKATTPERIEEDLMQLLPSSEWILFSHRLIHHGRRVCIARRPACASCPLLTACRRVGLPGLPSAPLPSTPTATTSATKPAMTSGAKSPQPLSAESPSGTAQSSRKAASPRGSQGKGRVGPKRP